MASAAQKVMCMFGLVSLAHVAYSAAQHRTYMRLTEQEFTGLPPDVLIQGVMSLVILMFSISHIAGEFKDIKVGADLDTKSWETVGNRPSFYIFNHRGKALFVRQQLVGAGGDWSYPATLPSGYRVVTTEQFPSQRTALEDDDEEDEDDSESEEM